MSHTDLQIHIYSCKMSKYNMTSQQYHHDAKQYAIILSGQYGFWQEICLITDGHVTGN